MSNVKPGKSKISLTKKALSPKALTKAPKALPSIVMVALTGELDAVTTFIKNLPHNTGMTFIYVAHLHSDHKNFLPEIISRITKMKVQEVAHVQHLKPDNIYIVPYDKGLAINNNHIELTPRYKNTSTLDILFTTLAKIYSSNVIGIIFTGASNDGVIGLKAIRNAGGITLAQDNSVLINNRPTSAIASGLVDHVLSPKEIALQIVRYSKNGIAKHNASRIKKEKSLLLQNADEKAIFEILHKQKGIDYSHYKTATIKRRIRHRMSLCNKKNLKDYTSFLLKNPTEVELLYNDCLINVTDFFRDTEVFHYLKNTLFPQLLNNKITNDALRIWVPACSSGQEVYSIAMLLYDLQKNNSRKVSVKIFATDISNDAIQKARLAEYSASEIRSIPKNYLKRYFTIADDNYRINKEIREMCTFALHNILNDAPFNRIDFISCRNMLIYFDTAAQKKVLETFHFSLTDNGYMMLGKSETTGLSSQLFNQLNNKFKIYSHKKDSRISKISELIPNHTGLNTDFKTKSTGIVSVFDNVINSTLLAHHTPPCVVINKEMQILQLRGDTSLFLKHPSGGRANLNILKMARPEFAFELRIAIQNVINTKESVKKSGIELKNSSGFHLMTLEVSPLTVNRDESLLLVVFTMQEQVIHLSDNNKGSKFDLEEKDLKIKKLTEELANLRSEMDSVIVAQEASYEELQAANEEIVSSNEELQTLNQELETSKVEMQATNEELISTNKALKKQNELLAESYHYSEAIIATIHEPMLVLDKHFNVKSANKSYYKKFSTTKEETEGQSLFKLGMNQWNIPKLHKLLQELVSKNKHFENLEITSEFHEKGERTLLINANRLVQKIHGEKLILLAIKDITEARNLAIELQLKEKQALIKQLNNEKKALSLIEESEKRYNMLIMKSPFAISILKSREMIITLANDSMKEMWGKGKYIEGKELTKVLPELKGQPFPELLDKVYTSGVPFYGNEMSILVNHKGKIKQSYFNFIYQPYLEADETISGVTIIAYDVTAQVVAKKQIEKAHMEQKDELEKAVKRRTKQLIQKNLELESANKDLTTFTYVSSHDLQEPLRKIQNFVSYILKKEYENLSEEGKGYFIRMQETAKRMQALIEDLLVYSQAKSTEHTFEKVNLNDIINEVKKYFEELITEKKAVITVRGLGEMSILSFQFRQLLQNLIGNSLKFSKQDTPPRISITGKIVKGKELQLPNLSNKINYHHIIFSDNGIGFDPKYKHRIFEVFQRLHSYEEYKGTGIGLAICKRIIENHNGSISATGKINKGARFDIYIPV